jgi:membrane protease YdiL (CAAX protease family)
VSSQPEDSRIQSPSPEPPADLVQERAPSPIPAEPISLEVLPAREVLPAQDVSLANSPVPALPEFPVAGMPPDPAWSGWDVVRMICVTIVSLFVGVFAVLFLARASIYPHRSLGAIASNPLVIVAGQSLAYFLVLGYMYVLVTRERRRPDFLAAIHWNWPSNVAIYVAVGFMLSLALQALAHFLPIPKELPIDKFFQTPAEAWALGILSITLAPLMEELFFRGFLYPVLARSLGLPVSVFLTALGFALLHGAQLMFSWGPVLVIFLVGLVLTMVRAKTNSVAAGVLIHMAYNATITVAMFVATDGFRHLERLNQ